MKRPNQKRKKLDNLYESAVMIRCCYCDIKADCKHRTPKEKSEKLGFTTFCSLTPNRPRSYNKAHAKKQGK